MLSAVLYKFRDIIIVCCWDYSWLYNLYCYYEKIASLNAFLTFIRGTIIELDEGGGSYPLSGVSWFFAPITKEVVALLGERSIKDSPLVITSHSLSSWFAFSSDEGFLFSAHLLFEQKDGPKVFEKNLPWKSFVES